jgi:hypothetical protein
LNKSFCPLSRRSFGSIAISPTQTQPETWNHADSAKSNCKEIDIDIPKTGDSEYFQNPRNHSARMASAFFTGDEIIKRANKLWEQAGSPEGRAEEFYHQAEQELEQERSSQMPPAPNSDQSPS